MLLFVVGFVGGLVAGFWWRSALDEGQHGSAAGQSAVLDALAPAGLSLRVRLWGSVGILVCSVLLVIGAAAEMPALYLPAGLVGGVGGIYLGINTRSASHSA